VKLSMELRERIHQVDPAQIGHYIGNGYMDAAIKPISPQMRCLGPAVTVRITGNDNAMLYYAILHAEEGSVIVVDRGGDRNRACCGDVVALSAQLRHLGGIVIDGMATDSLGIAEKGFPVFCRGVSAFTTLIHGVEGQMNIPIICGGVIVNPGDLIYGNADGVIVIPGEHLEELLSKAEEATRAELDLCNELITKGKTMSDFYPVIHTMSRFL